MHILVLTDRFVPEISAPVAGTVLFLRRQLQNYRFATCHEVLRQHSLLPVEKVPARTDVSQA